MKATVPVCNDCQKPHFGKNKSEDRCWCDTSGNYHFEEIEVDEPENNILTEHN